MKNLTFIIDLRDYWVKKKWADYLRFCSLQIIKQNLILVLSNVLFKKIKKI